MSLLRVSDRAVDGQGEKDPAQSLPGSPVLAQGYDGERIASTALSPMTIVEGGRQHAATWPQVSGADALLRLPSFTEADDLGSDGGSTSDLRKSPR